ncbi:MAG TPA: hypothetical protein VFQ53_10800 [Kofleriaceae bacterium]|nr:hypothetical protein [Kofleriaceae bacterium]
MKITTLGFCTAVTLIGCGTDEPTGPETLPGLEVPPPPDNGVQLITPIVHDLQPGSDNEICTWTDTFLDASTDIRSTLVSQNEPPGHHVVLYYTLEPQPPGTQRVCTDTDMASFRFITGNGGNLELNEAPGNLVYRVPAGAQLVVNHHYLNAGDTVMDGQAIVNVNYAPPGNYIPSGNLAVVDTGIDVPIGQSTHDISCTLEQSMKLWYLIPHMHRWGSRITVDVTQGGTKSRKFDTTWDDAFTFHPPEMRLDPTTPMTLAAGDKIDVHCEWNNDTDRSLPFGFEMCVSFGQFVDDGGIGNRACDNGNWTDF